MQPQNGLKDIEDRLERHIASTKRSRDHRKNLATNVTLPLKFILPASTAVFSLGPAFAVTDKNKRIFGVATAVCGVLTALSHGVDSYVWGRYLHDNRTLMQLYGIRDDMKFHQALGRQFSENEITQYHRQLQLCLTQANIGWEQEENNLSQPHQSPILPQPDVKIPEHQPQPQLQAQPHLPEVQLQVASQLPTTTTTTTTTNA
jgi:hypothetical protein